MSARAGGTRNGGAGAASYAYYPGCYALGSARELDMSTRAVCDRLGVELSTLDAAPCCGAGDLQHTDGARALALNALTLAQAAETGLGILTVCNVCTLSLRQADAELRGDAPVVVPDCQGAYDAGGQVPAGARQVRPPLPPEQAAAVHSALAAERIQCPADRTVAVTHLLWVLRDLAVSGVLADAVERTFRLSVAPFYGCQVLRPGDMNPEDDPDDPVALETIVAACGGAAVDHPARLSCCGWPVAYSREKTAGALAGAVVESARGAGADVIVTPCPLCQSSLERVQLGRASGVPPVPVLHLPQLVGLALGLQPDALGLERHAVETGLVLARLGLTFPTGAF